MGILEEFSRRKAQELRNEQPTAETDQPSSQSTEDPTNNLEYVDRSDQKKNHTNGPHGESTNKTAQTEGVNLGDVGFIGEEQEDEVSGRVSIIEIFSDQHVELTIDTFDEEGDPTGDQEANIDQEDFELTRDGGFGPTEQPKFPPGTKVKVAGGSYVGSYGVTDYMFNMIGEDGMPTGWRVVVEFDVEHNSNQRMSTAIPEQFLEPWSVDQARDVFIGDDEPVVAMRNPFHKTAQHDFNAGDYVKIVDTPFRGQVLFSHRSDNQNGALVRVEVMKGSMVIGKRWWFKPEELEHEGEVDNAAENPFHVAQVKETGHVGGDMADNETAETGHIGGNNPMTEGHNGGGRTPGNVSNPDSVPPALHDQEENAQGKQIT
jgi:hypothetical protein